MLMTSSEQDVLKSTIYIEYQIEHSHRHKYLKTNRPSHPDGLTQTVRHHQLGLSDEGSRAILTGQQF